MIGVFKQKNPANAFVLLIYALILKFPLFLQSGIPLKQAEDNYLYKLILRFLEPIGGQQGFLYGFLAFLLIFLQASLLNRVANSIKLFPKPNYLVGMSFLLVTSFMREWNQFSSTLIVNFLLIWIFYGMVGWYNNNKPVAAVFNVSLLVGVLPLLYTPSVSYILLLILAIIITRPIRFSEIIVSLIGCVAPYYFLLIILFLTDNLKSNELLPVISFHLPRIPSSLWITGAVLLILTPFLIGGYFVQDNLTKMLIQVRKCWSLLLSILLVGLLIIMANPGDNYQHWLLSTLPIACFHAATYFYPTNRLFPAILHWIIFSFAIMINYFPQLTGGN